MARLRRLSLDLLYGAGEFGDGHATVFKTAATATTGAKLGILLLGAGENLRNGELFLLRHL